MSPRTITPRPHRGSRQAFALSVALQVVAGIVLSAAFVGLAEGGSTRWLGLFLVVCFALLFARGLALASNAASASADPLLARLEAKLERPQPQLRDEFPELIERGEPRRDRGNLLDMGSIILWLSLHGPNLRLART